MSTLFICDDYLQGLDAAGLKKSSDWSFINCLMNMGEDVFLAHPHQINSDGLVENAQQLALNPAPEAGRNYYANSLQTFDLSKPCHVEMVFTRQDPPHDVKSQQLYQTAARGLVKASAQNPHLMLINDPSLILSCSEKKFPLQFFPQFHPKTLITNNCDDALAFYKQQLGVSAVVLKLEDSYAGRGIELLLQDADHSAKIQDFFAKYPNEDIVVQQVLDGNGDDLSVFVIGGKVLPIQTRDTKQTIGGVIRRPAAVGVPANVAQGGVIVPYTLTQQQVEMAKVVGDQLMQHGIFIARIDMMESRAKELRITEVNYTSPTLFNELQQHINMHAAASNLSLNGKPTDQFDVVRYTIETAIEAASNYKTNCNLTQHINRGCTKD